MYFGVYPEPVEGAAMPTSPKGYEGQVAAALKIYSTNKFQICNYAILFKYL
jgi:hypothetical protein